MGHTADVAATRTPWREHQWRNADHATHAQGHAEQRTSRHTTRRLPRCLPALCGQARRDVNFEGNYNLEATGISSSSPSSDHEKVLRDERRNDSKRCVRPSLAQCIALYHTAVLFNYDKGRVVKLSVRFRVIGPATCLQSFAHVRGRKTKITSYSVLDLTAPPDRLCKVRHVPRGVSMRFSVVTLASAAMFTLAAAGCSSSSQNPPAAPAPGAPTNQGAPVPGDGAPVPGENPAGAEKILTVWPTPRQTRDTAHAQVRAPATECRITSFSALISMPIRPVVFRRFWLQAVPIPR